MADIINLRSGALPPAGCDWVLVERTPAGRFNVTVCTSGQGHSLYVYDQGLFPLASAVAKAIGEADRLGIGSVHIQEGRSD